MSKEQTRIARRRFVAILAALAAMTVLALPFGPAKADRAAEQFVAKVANQAIAAARTGSAASFRGLVKRNSAISAVALFALGKHRRKLPSSKRSQYYSLVTNLVAKLFSDNAKSFAGQSYVVQSSSARSSKDIIVKGVILFAGGRAAQLDWRVVRSGSRYRIFDVRVKGVWLAVQMRQQFVSVLNKAGGDFNALLRYLKS